jgi:hypothetical protein
MSAGALLLMVSSVVANPPSDMNYGVIDGVVTNGTRGDELVAGIDVALRVHVDGQFVGLARTTSESDGRFRFENLPIDAQFLYLPGASQSDVHFPGPRIRLGPDQPHASITLTVFDPIVEQNPLRIESHSIVVDAQPGVLRVTESIRIENPSRHCYVGRAMHHDAAPVTLQLAIPAEFERVTFDEEALGRRFSLINDSLVTGIPWPPGKRDVNFSYVIANEKNHCVWERAVDLPCSSVSLTVRVDNLKDVICSLPMVQSNEEGRVRFESKEDIPTGHVVRLELGRLPIPAMVHARRISFLILAALIIAVSLVSVRPGFTLSGLCRLSNPRKTSR